MSPQASFQEWFCLKDRLSFTIDPLSIVGDQKFYFGRDDERKRLINQLKRSFISPGVPKMEIYGPFGSGKTHTLWHLKYILESDPPNSCKGKPYVVYTAVEMRQNSDASHLHAQILEALGKTVVADWVTLLASKPEGLEDSLGVLTDDFNIRSALREVRMGGGESSLAAWRWLTGQIQKSSELDKLQITRNLGDVNTGDLAEALISVGRLAEALGFNLIFLLDELEGLNYVRSGDNANSISQYLRRLAEPANSSTGFIIGFAANVPDDIPKIIDRADVRTRIGPSNIIPIEALPAVRDVKEFISSLVKDLVDERCSLKIIDSNNLTTNRDNYPFEPSALEFLAERALDDPVLALPRLIIHAINECAIQAWDDEKYIVDDEIVGKIAPQVFDPTSM